MSSQKLLGLPPITPALKSILPFIQRADEVKQQDPVIAYWCTYYAAQQGIASHAKDTPSRQFLFALLDTLERMKKEAGPTDAIDDEAASCAYVENFAIRVFSLADNEDRKGNSTRATAKKFLAAANFLEILHTFPEAQLSDDNIQEKIRYSKWKAADIAKAFREGRKPTPGPAASETQADSVISHQPENAHSTEESDIPIVQGQFVTSTEQANPPDHIQRSAWVSGELEGQPSPIAMTPPPMPPRPPSASFMPSDTIHPEASVPPCIIDQHMPQFSQLPPSPPPIPSAPTYCPSTVDFLPTQTSAITLPPPPPPVGSTTQIELTPSLVVKAQKHCRYAISALDYEDAEQARKELRTALALLGG